MDVLARLSGRPVCKMKTFEVKIKICLSISIIAGNQRWDARTAAGNASIQYSTKFLLYGRPNVGIGTKAAGL